MLLAPDVLTELDEIDFLESQATSAATAIFTPPPDTIAPVYIDNLTNHARIQVLYGGSSSGKSVSKAQQAVIDVLCNGRNWLVCRKIGKDSRHSTFVEVERAIEAWGVDGRFKINRTDMTMTADTGYRILFKGLDDLEKLKSITTPKGAITDIWVEEATQTEQDDIRQLLRRQRGGDPTIPKRLHLTFNPVLRSSWIYKAYFAPAGWADDQTRYDGDNLTIQKTTYKDNPFLAQDEIDILENETEPYWYEVYTLGNWGALGDVIFTNWKVADLSGMVAHFTNRCDGLDFGYGGSPAAYASIHYDRKRKAVYVFKEVYEWELTNDALAASVKPFAGKNYVICDSAEPKSIAELKIHGIRALSSKKGPDSVNYGIQWLKQQTIIVDKRCINMQNELALYQWKKDKDGNSLEVPVDKNNHLIAALRYGLESEMIPPAPLTTTEPEKSKWHIQATNTGWERF